MNFKEHCEVTYTVFLYPYDNIHIWLDETSKDVEPGKSKFNHWINRHHKKAIDSKYKDNLRRSVAYFHVICDLAKTCFN